MSNGGLVRGGGKAEIALRDVPGVSSHLITRKTAEPIARQYEAMFPGVVVVCDWELFSDADIASMQPHLQKQALADRVAVESRREAAKEINVAPDPLRAGDPTRTAEVLRRVRIDMNNLDVTHPEYERLFFDFAAQINALEKSMNDAGLPTPVTAFKIGHNAGEAPPAEKTDEKLLAAKVASYQSMGKAKRQQLIAETSDVDLARAILGVEKEPDLRELIVKKMFTMGATV